MKFMSKKAKLTLQELEEVKKRVEMINGYVLIINLLQGSFAQFRKLMEDKYELDATHNWGIDLLTGKFLDEGVKEPKPGIPTEAQIQEALKK